MGFPRLALLTAVALLLPLTAMPPAVAGSDHLDPVPADKWFYDGTIGGDGNGWFRGTSALVRIATDGTTTRFPLDITWPTPVTATDGSVWVAANYRQQVWRIDPNADDPKLELIHDFGDDIYGLNLVPAGGGRVWARTQPKFGTAIAYTLLDTSGLVDTFPLAPYTYVQTPAAGAPDGSVWFTTEDAQDHLNSTITRLGVDGSTSQVTLKTDEAGDEGVTSMAFDATGTLWYTTYDVGDCGNSFGGGIGFYADGTSSWWRPSPYTEPDYHPCEEAAGPVPDQMQAGPDGWMYFSKLSPDQELRLARVDKSREIQFVEFPSHRRPRINGDTVWMEKSNKYAVGSLSALFDEGTERRRISLRFNDRKGAYEGRIRSVNSGCEHAVVRLHRMQPGKDPVVRKGRANLRGKFVLRLRNLPGDRYYVKVKRNALPGGVTTCLAKKSGVPSSVTS